ncbi:hypothetical protein [Streptomyces sp. NPDC001719]
MTAPLRAIKPDAKQVPHFRHESSRECPASTERQREIALDDQVVIDLRDLLLRAWPGATVCLDLPEDPGSQEPGRVPPGWMPPAIVVSGPDGPVVIERPRKLPDPEQTQRRLHAVRARYGSGARHVWFLAKDPLQFAKCGKLHVTPRGHDRDVHVTIAPTEQQLAIIAAGGGVYWLDGQQVLIPYGVHDFTHTPRDNEDWNFTDWRRGHWHKDWHISHPLPAPDATRWGLAPLSLHQMTSTKASFSLNEARDLMQRLEDVQRARGRRRRADARELYATRHTPAPPAVAETPGAGQLIPPAPPEQQDTAPEPPAAADQTGGQVPNEPSDRPDSPVTSPAPPERTGSAPTPEPPSSPPAPPNPPPSAPPAAPPTVPPPSAVPAPPPYPPPAPPIPLPEQRPRGLRGMLRRLLGGQ